MMLASIILISYFVGKTVVMRIDYAGGSIGLPLKFFGYDEASTFVKTIRRAKDAVTGYQNQ